MRRARRVSVVGIVVTALGAGLAGPSGSASAAAPPSPSVITVDDSRSEWRSSVGNPPTKLRAGRPDVYPGLASDDGRTAAWLVGAALPQIVIAYDGAPTAGASDYQATGKIIYDVASGAPYAASAVQGADGRWTVRSYEPANGAYLSEYTYDSAVLDLWLSQDGAAVYLLLAGITMSVWKCNIGGLGTCSRIAVLDGVPAAVHEDAFPLWDHVSADGTTIAGVLDTGTASTPGHPQFDGWSITGLPGSPVVKDAGAGLTDDVGRFVGNNLYVATPGHLLEYAAPVVFAGAAPSADTPMTMTGRPRYIEAPGSTYDGTFTLTDQIPTSTSLLRLVNGAFVSQTSQGLAITTTMSLYPGTTASDKTWPYYYWDTSVSHVQYSYDKVTWTDWPWSSSVFQIHQNVWLKAVHDNEINATASSSAPVLISAKPVVTAGYKAVTRTMYGMATVPDGTKVYVQRQISPNTWSTYATPLAKARAYSVKLPAVHGHWRAVALATSTYIQSISTTVVT
jgi:hypothetical protein